MSELASKLCTSCGLCCAGALFTRGTLLPQEVDWARKKRLNVIQRDEGLSFTVPCHLLEKKSCTVYEDRPQICRAFVCKLLVRLEAGEITLEDAQVKVRRLDELYQSAKTHTTTSSVEALLDLGELEALATRDFRDPYVE
jgi:hypothetical protein